MSQSDRHEGTNEDTIREVTASNEATDFRDEGRHDRNELERRAKENNLPDEIKKEFLDSEGRGQH